MGTTSGCLCRKILNRKEKIVTFLDFAKFFIFSTLDIRSELYFFIRRSHMTIIQWQLCIAKLQTTLLPRCRYQFGLTGIAHTGDVSTAIQVELYYFRKFTISPVCADRFDSFFDQASSIALFYLRQRFGGAFLVQISQSRIWSKSIENPILTT